MNCEHSGAKLERMCSCCRKPIANGAASLILNGMYAHVECIELVMAEPWSMEQVTDDQLRAECHRRGIATETGEEKSRANRDRDEWKRRAEAAEARIGVHRSFANSARRSREEMHAEFMQLVAVLTPEQAKAALDKLQSLWANDSIGIAAKLVTSRAAEDWPDPWDFLEDA